MRVSVLSCCLAVMAAGGLASARTASFRRADAHTQAGMKIECEARVEVPAVCFPPHAKCEGPLYKYKIDTEVDQKLRDLCSRVCRCVDDPTKKQPKAVQFADELCEMTEHHGLENYEPENKVLLSEKPPVTKAPVRKLPVNKSGKSWLDLDDHE